jgi:hypothetical protein
MRKKREGRVKIKGELKGKKQCESVTNKEIIKAKRVQGE